MYGWRRAGIEPTCCSIHPIISYLSINFCAQVILERKNKIGDFLFRSAVKMKLFPETAQEPSLEANSGRQFVGLLAWALANGKMSRP